MINNFSEKDYKLLKQLVGLDKKAMLLNMASYLKKKYGSVIATPDYLYVEGTIPIALVAHLDTVFPTPAYEVYYDREQQVIWSPQGLGTDDRAGILAIVKLVREGYRPHIILTMDEELGALGASALTTVHPTHPFHDLKYIIQLDRRGKEDSVFYDCDNQLFEDYVNSFGFKTARGTFSDISIICPSWGIAGVNLSIGYEEEHSYVETFHTIPFLQTYNRVKRMLSCANDIAEPYTYIPSRIALNPFNRRARCSHCGRTFTEFDLFPAKGRDGSVKFYCVDCMVGNMAWCEQCNEGFEILPGEEISPICPDCRDDLMKSKLNGSKQ